MRFPSPYRLFAIFFAVIAFFCFSDLQAQKNKKEKKTTIPESKLREAEFYFTEGEKFFILEDYAKAMVLFQKSLEINPDNATVYFKMAEILLRGNELDNALESVLKALDLDANNKYFYLLAADIYSRKANFKEASEMYEEMLGKIEGTEKYLFDLASLYLYQNRLDDALSTYQRIEQLFGVSESVAFQKQKIFLKMNRLNDAVMEGEKLIKAFPTDEAYPIALARLLISNDKVKDALPYLENYLDNEHESGQARLLLAETYQKLGDQENFKKNIISAFENPEVDPEKKVQILAENRNNTENEELIAFSTMLGEKLVKAHPEYSRAYAVYGDLLYSQKKIDGAKKAFLKAKNLGETGYAIWNNLVQLYFQQSKWDSVILLSEEALEIHPNQGAFFYFNGAANLQTRNYEEAVFALEQGKKLSGSDKRLESAFNGLLGDAYNGARQYQQSDEAYEAALAHDPTNFPVLNNYSYYLALRKENLDKAEKMSTRLIKNNPENPTYLDTHAWVLYMQKKYKEAKKIMEKAIALSEDSGNDNATYYEHYGDILYRLGEVDQAVKQWEKARSLNDKLDLIDKKIADRKLYE